MNETARQHLSEQHAASGDVNTEWDQSNQQWWDWYMSLAENAGGENAATGQQLIDLPTPAPQPPLAVDELTRELAEPYKLDAQQVEHFQQHGWIKLRGVLSPAACATLREELSRLFAEAEGRLGDRFASLEMMWQTSQAMRAFVFSPRLAQLAAELTGAAAVRLYHDNGMSKQPGCGRTPWHYDDHHFPIASDRICTAWAPLQAIPESMGPLGFASGMGLVDAIADIPFNKFDDSYDRRISERLAGLKTPVEASGFELGEVSFHHGKNLHTAGPNRTTTPRMVLATTYFEDGARVIDAPHMVNGDWRHFMPGVEPGERIDSPLNPVLYRR
ncbi:MAG: phytanoyl-CoA dioxygenase family protein [Planctomycetota bacterium]